MTDRPRPQLWNPDKRGTLIVGDARTGTHFLQRVIADRVVLDRSVRCNDEIDIGWQAYWPRTVRAALDALEDDRAYQVAIVNGVVAKNELIAHPSAIEHWHVIRLTRRDKVGWFRSWGLFFMHENSEYNQQQRVDLQSGFFLHHGTSSDAYLSSLQRRGPIVLGAQDIEQIGGHVSLHVLSKLIAVDEEVDYDTLPALQSDNAHWKGNQYPDIDLAMFFENWPEIEAMLAGWTDIDVPGRFR